MMPPQPNGPPQYPQGPPNTMARPPGPPTNLGPLRMNAGPMGPPQMSKMGPPARPALPPMSNGQMGPAPPGPPMMNRPGLPPASAPAGGPNLGGGPAPYRPAGPPGSQAGPPPSSMGGPMPARPGVPPGQMGPPSRPGMPVMPNGAQFGPPRHGSGPPHPASQPGPMGAAPGGPPRPQMSGGQFGPPPPNGMGPPAGPPGMSGPPRPGGYPPHPSGPASGYPAASPAPGPGYPPAPQGPPGMGGYPPAPANGGYPPQPPGPGQAPGPGMNQMNPQYPGAQSPRRALDPDQMPSPIHVMEEDQNNNKGYFETREKGQTPPLVTTDFICRDFGNASPRFIRSTMYNVPATTDMMKQTGVPFGLVIAPFAPVQEGEIEPPVSDFGPTGPVRCHRCKAYMCPFMQFIDGGRRFQCVFCKYHSFVTSCRQATTEVPQEYFQHLDHNGQRLDHYQRPELCLGAYECLATTDYCRDSKEPNVPGIIFAIDVSYPMMKEGVVQLICRNMKRMLHNLPSDTNCDKERPRVGFMTYDSKIHFYNINKGLSQPQQLNVGDVEDMFVPLVEGFMVKWEDSEQVIDSLMEQIPLMYGETRETETVLGPVIQAGKEAFKAANAAGKLIIFHHNLPVAEAPGKLKNRDDRKLLATEKEKTVLTPQTKFYNEVGQECVAVGCSVDLFLFNNAYIDVATLSQVSRMTGGQVFKYTYFLPEIDGERFLRDLEYNLKRPIAFDAIMRVRTSTGVRPVDFFGSFFMANTTDTELAAINGDAAVTCEIKHDDKLTEEDGVYIQAAILFTSCSGQRRLRVLNLSLNCGSNMAEVFRTCELDTVVNFIAKQSISRLMDSNPKAVKDQLISNCANILACYRKNCTTSSSMGQLILPECLKLLPLYTNCLIKSDALSGGTDVGCDDRAYLMNAVSSMDVASTVVYFYPRLFAIHDVSPSETGLPNQTRCSIEKIRDDGVYLLENGLFLFMYIGLSVDPVWIQEVFGVSLPQQINLDQSELEERNNPLSKRVKDIVETIQSQRSRHMRLVVVRQREKLDILFRHYLCEDRSGNDNCFSYVDFLCHMHKEIRALLG
ncbi:hypothetical protein TCAL_17342 [Tigriopus californicus]|uniref:Protein transport protein Sec24C n=1 Tax=Tigriopus californicus TaxID=6832 RepID=A0A553NZZ1_TIGCA|nr:hypothetical protein TCAL_17342 [Tigriopus californicus]